MRSGGHVFSSRHSSCRDLPVRSLCPPLLKEEDSQHYKEPEVLAVAGDVGESGDVWVLGTCKFVLSLRT